MSFCIIFEFWIGWVLGFCIIAGFWNGWSLYSWEAVPGRISLSHLRSRWKRRFSRLGDLKSYSYCHEGSLCWKNLQRWHFKSSFCQFEILTFELLRLVADLPQPAGLKESVAAAWSNSNVKRLTLKNTEFRNDLTLRLPGLPEGVLVLAPFREFLAASWSKENWRTV